MYISEFWCGVGAAILTEIILLIIYAIYLGNKNKK